MKDIATHPAQEQTIDIEYAYYDNEATLLGDAIANMVVPDEFQPILNQFYDDIFQLKHKVDELRSIQRQFNEWNEISVDIHQPVDEKVSETNMFRPFDMGYKFVNTYSQRLKEILTTVTQNLLNIQGKQSHDQSLDIRNIIINVIGELSEISYRVEKYLLTLRDVQHSIKTRVIQS